jgi:hypothetical protein
MDRARGNSMGNPERNLWSAVLLQAQADIAECPIDSVDYEQARSFLLAPGEWRESREAIGDLLGMPASAIERAGRNWINARRRSLGLPPETPPVPRRDVKLPRLVAIPAAPKLPRRHTGWQRPDGNPFARPRRAA